MGRTVSRVAAVRKRRQLAVAELARQAGVSRQTVYAIEDGSFVPNTTTALRMSRALGVSVEELFSVEDTPDAPFEAELLLPSGQHPVFEGQPVRLCEVGDRLIAVPGEMTFPTYFPDADGVLAGHQVQAAMQPVSGERLLVAGCDPALSLIQPAGVEIISVGTTSRQSLEWLREGRIHAAGSHLLDPSTGDYNVPFVKRAFPTGAARVITFAGWQQGLLVRRGNPKSIRELADLARDEICFINREEGSGSRKLLDSALLTAGIAATNVRGYRSCADGHLDVGRRVYSGEADAGIATESAARYFGLQFIQLAVERFDLTFTDVTLPAAQALINVLTSGAFRNRLQLIAGYDTSETGKVQL